MFARDATYYGNSTAWSTAVCWAWAARVSDVILRRQSASGAGRDGIDPSAWVPFDCLSASGTAGFWSAPARRAQSRLAPATCASRYPCPSRSQGPSGLFARARRASRVCGCSSRVQRRCGPAGSLHSEKHPQDCILALAHGARDSIAGRRLCPSTQGDRSYGGIAAAVVQHPANHVMRFQGRVSPGSIAESGIGASVGGGCDDPRSILCAARGCLGQTVGQDSSRLRRDWQRKPESHALLTVRRRRG